MIVAYTGLAGSGKTYHMTQTALKLIERGEIVFSRHELEGAYPLVDEREMLRMRDCHIFFDEWHQDHNAREWFSMDEVLKHIITQSRKYGITIHWSAQHWLYMDSFIRRNTDFCWKHWAVWRDADTGISKIGMHKAIKVAGMEEELKHTRPDILAKKTIWIKKKVFSKYDSYKPIMLDKAKLSDDAIARILDPYAREKMTITPKENHKVRSAVEVIGSSTDPLPDTLSEFEKSDTNNDAKTDAGDLEDRIEREYITDHADSLIEKSNPT